MTSVGASTKLLALLGQPVAHSLSPAMQQAAIQSAGLDMIYLAMEVPPALLGEAIRGLAALGAAGANLTVPHKEACLEHLDELSPLAAQIGAANTIVFREGKAVGYNTDASGFVESVAGDADLDLSGKFYAQVGAGGAGRAMAFGAAQAGAARIVLANRTRERAERLASDLRKAYPKTRIDAVDLILGAPETFFEADVVANATSLGLNPGDPSPLPVPCFRPDALVVDAIYSRGIGTPLLRQASQAGIFWTLDGRGMLARQGALAFELWTGKAPDLKAMRRALDQAIDAEK